MRKKKPVLAASLAGVFGPVGFLYLGWRHAVSMFVLWALIIFLISLRYVAHIPFWVHLVGRFIDAGVAYFLAIECSHKPSASRNEIAGIIATILTGFLIFTVTIYTGFIILHTGTVLLIEKSYFRGILSIVIFAPLLAGFANWTSSLILSLIPIPDLFAYWCAKDVGGNTCSEEKIPIFDTLGDACCEEIISIFNVLNDAVERFDCRACEMLREQIVEAIQEEPAEFTEKVRCGVSPEQAVYSMLANISGDLLESGQYQWIAGHPGVLNPTGADLLRIFESAIDEMCEMKAIDSAEAKRQKIMLRKNIGVDQRFNPHTMAPGGLDKIMAEENDAE